MSNDRTSKLVSFFFIQSMFILILSISFSPVSFGSNEISKKEINKLEELVKKETMLTGAAIEVFLVLRDKFGERLRAIGGLIYCGEKDLALELVIPISEIMIEADKVLDTLDLSAYGILELPQKTRSSLIRRATTATKAYSLSTHETVQLAVKLRPDFRKSFCKQSLESYKEIKSVLEK